MFGSIAKTVLKNAPLSRLACSNVIGGVRNGGRRRAGGALNRPFTLPTPWAKPVRFKPALPPAALSDDVTYSSLTKLLRKPPRITVRPCPGISVDRKPLLNSGDHAKLTIGPKLFLSVL